MQRDYTNLLKLLALIWLGLGLVVLIFWALVQLSEVVLLFVIAALIAVFFAPAVNRLQGLLPKRFPRVISILIVYIFGFSILLGLFAALSLPLIEQSRELAQQLPDLIKSAPQAIPAIDNLFRSFGLNVDTSGLIQRFNEQLQSIGEQAIRGVGAGLVAVTSAVGELVVAIIVSVYMLLSGPEFRRRFLGQVPEEHKEDADNLITRLIDIAAGFIRSQILLAVLIGVPVGLFLYAIGLPYSALLGLFSGIMEFVPVVGSIIGAIPAVLIALIVGGTNTALIVIAFFVLVNQLESTFIAPRVVGGQLGLHPITAIFALTIGFSFFGIWGAVLAAPAAAVLWAIWTQAYAAWPKIFEKTLPEQVAEETQAKPRRKPRAKPSEGS